MPGPYDKFQEAFETFQTELREELHGELERLRQPLAATPQVTQEVPNLHDELAAFGEELVREVQTLLMQIPQEKPNPLAFYETILRVRSHSPRRHGRPVPKNPPYFADVFNDVVSYFGGRETTDPLGQRFITEAEKRFAYVKIPKTTDPVYRKRKRRLTLHDLAHQTFREVFNQDEDIFIVWDNPEIVLDFDERDFAVLRPVEHQRVEEDIIDGEKPVRIAKFNVIDHLLNVGHPNDAIATFVIKYLQFLKSETTVPLDPNNLGFSVLRTEQEELKEHLEYLNNMMYLSMRFQQIPAPDVLAKIAEDFADKLGFEGYQQLLASDDLKLIGKLSEGLLKQEERYEKFYTSLHDMFAAVADQPIEVESGQWEPRIRKQINYLIKPPLNQQHPRISITHADRLFSDVELELINGLAGLPNYMAAVKTRSGEYLVQTTPPPQGVSERAFRARVRRIWEHNLLDGYVRKREDVEKEIMERKPLLPHLSTQPIQPPHLSSASSMGVPPPLPQSRKKIRQRKIQQG